MYVLAIHSFSEIDMEFTMDFYFRQFWMDPRLAFQKESGMESIKPGYEYGRTLWFPDTFFVNEKESFLHTITTKNEYYRIDHTGDVVKSVRWDFLANILMTLIWLLILLILFRLSVTFSCPMNFKTYPMDKQICSVPIESCNI